MMNSKLNRYAGIVIHSTPCSSHAETNKGKCEPMYNSKLPPFSKPCFTLA